jgi:hypothetical protein
MTKTEAWYRRVFCTTIDYYGAPMKLGEVHYKLISGELQYVYVGKNKLWVQYLKTNENG